MADKHERTLRLVWSRPEPSLSDGYVAAKYDQKNNSASLHQIGTRISFSVETSKLTTFVTSLTLAVEKWGAKLRRVRDTRNKEYVFFIERRGRMSRGLFYSLIASFVDALKASGVFEEPMVSILNLDLDDE